MCNYVGLRKISGSAKAIFQVLKKTTNQDILSGHQDYRTGPLQTAHTHRRIAPRLKKGRVSVPHIACLLLQTGYAEYLPYQPAHCDNLAESIVQPRLPVLDLWRGLHSCLQQDSRIAAKKQ